MILRPELRHAAGFHVQLSFTDRNGSTLRVAGRCTDFSASGMRVETRDRLEPNSTVVVTSTELGRLGHATVRYCRRETMRYIVGLHFYAQIKLGGHARSSLLRKVAGTTDPSK
jgi:hypothetical protein